ncbi:M23 family metallopeptidase [Neobacillus sp. OS1-32]|uniref:M23 family metallopeptidase n=1 Tax=Neobacillus sp. OS1-32 TaxID=3070682 RepID=UPI0027E05A0C|nr:M23 family metallopeptidase [Neobacillus sp. OS1-32]WML29554.1 M23 family metallopeptidase [Neobacillus sp. OS1-32]
MAFSNKRYLILKTSVISTLAVSTIAFSTGPLAFANTDKTNAYQVYVNGTYAGNISNKKVVNPMSEKPEEISKSQPTSAPKDLYIPERVLSNTAKGTQPIKTLKDVFQIKIQAAAIVIDGKPVVYLDRKETAQEVMRNLMLQYVSKDQLEELEARKSSLDKALPPLKDDETRIVDVHFSKNVSVSEQNVEPEKILALRDAVTYLQKGTVQDRKYTVQNGDTLESIARQHGLKLKDLLELNPQLSEKTLLKIGQEMNVTTLTPLLEVIVEKETKKKETIPFATKTVENSSLTKGHTKITQEGKDGLQSVIYNITEQNGTETYKEKVSQQTLKQPVNRVVVKGTKVIPSRGEGDFAWPTVGGYISSQMGYRWGKLHKGIDIARPSDRTIKAADNGVVVAAGWGSGYGNRIIIDHRNGFRTLYGHMSSLKVKAGQAVSKGMAIGIMGSTGNSTGVHLHFEVYKNGGLVNPLKYINR